MVTRRVGTTPGQEGNQRERGDSRRRGSDAGVGHDGGAVRAAAGRERAQERPVLFPPPTGPALPRSSMPCVAVPGSTLCSVDSPKELALLSGHVELTVGPVVGLVGAEQVPV